MTRRSAPSAAARAAASTIFLTLASKSPTEQLIWAIATLTFELMNGQSRFG
jgi:hypothetical protein